MDDIPQPISCSNMSHLGLLQHWITYLDLQDNKSSGSNVENNHDDDDDTDGDDNHENHDDWVDGDDLRRR